MGRSAPPAKAPRDAPWPGSLPAPLPATVFADRLPVGVLDGAASSSRRRPRQLTAAPAVAHRRAADAAPVAAWAGPWPVVERWWDAERAERLHRFQIVDADGCAWLLVRDDDGWWAEARYD